MQQKLYPIFENCHHRKNCSDFSRVFQLNGMFQILKCPHDSLQKFLESCSILPALGDEIIREYKMKFHQLTTQVKKVQK